MQNGVRFRGVLVALMASVSFSGLAVGADTYYYRVKAPELGVIVDLKPIVSGDTAGMVGKEFKADVSVSQGQNKGPFTFAVSAGQLPPGVTLNAGTGQISGIPISFGTFSATITANGRDKANGTTEYVTKINAALEISGSAASQVAVGDSYYAAFSANGGDGRYTWSLQGTLPDGLIFANGKIAGTPYKVGVFSGLVVTVRDGSGVTKSSNAFSIEVSDLSRTVSSSQSNLVLSSLFSSSEWQSEKPKRVIIPSGVVVYSDTPSSAALDSGANWGGALTLQVSGEIQAAGGVPVANAKGGNGGDAIVAHNSGMIVLNSGAIRAGGGAGGSGGKGADGQYSVNQREPTTGSLLSFADSDFSGCGFNGVRTFVIYFKGQYIYSISMEFDKLTVGDYDYYCGPRVNYYGGSKFSGQSFMFGTVYRVAAKSTVLPSTGGNGGIGGGGRGHAHNLGAGLAGSAGVGDGAGAGGTGGSGGDWGANGQSGANGAVSNISANPVGVGFPGGSPGYAIRGDVDYRGPGIKQGL